MTERDKWIAEGRLQVWRQVLKIRQIGADGKCKFCSGGLTATGTEQHRAGCLHSEAKAEVEKA